MRTSGNPPTTYLVTLSLALTARHPSHHRNSLFFPRPDGETRKFLGGAFVDAANLACGIANHLTGTQHSTDSLRSLMRRRNAECSFDNFEEGSLFPQDYAFALRHVEVR